MYVPAAELARRLDKTIDEVEKLAFEQNWRFKIQQTSDGEDLVLFDFNKIDTSIDTKSSEDFFVLQSAEYRGTDKEIFDRYRDKQLKRLDRRGDGITRLVFNQTLPVGITFIGDQHIGNNCNFERMVQDAEVIANTEGMFAVSGGDGIDNYIKHWSAMVSKVSRPSDELRAFRHYLSIFAHKLLLMISGNHDAWSEDFAGINLIREVAKDLHIQYSPNWRGILKIHFKDTLASDGIGGFDYSEDDIESPTRPYGILLQHKGVGNLRTNPGHACQKTYDIAGAPGIDIVGIGHSHVGWFGPFERQQRTIWGVRWASYKVRDEFATRHGFLQSNVAIAPAVILYPDQKKIICFEDVRDAGIFLKAVRDEYKAKAK